MAQPSDLLRYGLWGLVAATADANRREYHMSTTWLPHFLTNTVTLFLPDIYRAIVPNEQAELPNNDLTEIRQTLDAMIRDNPSYVAYVAPLALGYILSHPRFNIYKGEMAELRLAGFGLDALPHGATALALTALVHDTADKAAGNLHTRSTLSELVQASDQHPAILSATILTLATLWWEVGEYLIHRHELALRGDVTKINMQWSWRDTLNDCAANLVGWGLALGLYRLQRSRRFRA